MTYIVLHTQLVVYWIDYGTHIHTPILISTLDCVHKHSLSRGAFLFHAYRSVSISRMQRYMQLAYLFRHCRTSLLSRDGRIVDCTMRQPSVQRPFSSVF